MGTKALIGLLVGFSAFFTSANIARAELTPEERGVVVQAVMSGNFAVLDELAEYGEVDVEAAVLPPAPAPNANFNCSCHAVDPQFEYICNPLGFGRNCKQVGSIVCIPRCGG